MGGCGGDCAVYCGGSGSDPGLGSAKLRALGLDAERAWPSAGYGRGPWWNAGASHMNQALPAAYFTRKGLISLLREQQRLQCAR